MSVAIDLGAENSAQPSEATIAEVPAPPAVPKLAPFAFVASAKDLASALKFVGRVVDHRASMPILSNVMLRAKGAGELEIIGTNLSTFVRATIPACIDGAGGVCVSPKALAAMLPKSGEVMLSRRPNYSVTIEHGGTRSNVVGMPSDDFPPPWFDRTENVSQTVALSLRTDALRAVLSQTAYAQSPDDTRPHLAGILLETDGATLRTVATDGHRLVKAENSVAAIVSADAPSISMLLSSVAVDALATMLGKKATPDATVRFAQCQRRVYAHLGAYSVATDCSEQAFPAYQQVIPAECTRTATVDRDAFIAAVKACSAVSTDRSSGVKLEFAGERLVCTSENPDVGTVANTVACTYADEWKFAAYKPIDGVDEAESRAAYDALAERAAAEHTTLGFKIGANSRYIIEACAALPKGPVTLGMTGELDPMVFHGGTRDAYIAVVMPMRMRI